MAQNLDNAADFSSAEYNIPSAYTYCGKRVFYHELFKNPPDGLKEAVQRIVPKISMRTVEMILNATPGLSDIRKEYLKKAMQLRYDRMLVPTLKKVKAENAEPDRGRGR